MELPDRIEDMTPAQRMHLDMLIDQVDAEFPLDRMDEEHLAKDPNLAILPSGMKVSTRNVKWFGIDEDDGTATVRYFGDIEEDQVNICDPHDIAAFNAALNDIGVYVAAPTLKGDDADGDGILNEGAPV